MENDSERLEISKDLEVSLSENAATMQKLLEDKDKARKYIKSCKNIIKKQSDQLKKQQNEFKTTVNALETQSFTMRFHSVAFKLELDVMRLINIRRRIDTVVKKKGFIRFSVQIAKARTAESLKIRGAYALLKSAIGNICRYIKNKKKSKLLLAFNGIKLVSAGKSQNPAVAKYESLKKENVALKNALKNTGKSGNFEEIVEENKGLKEKLKSTELSVGNFIKEMGNLLNFHEPPVSHDNDSPKPALKLKRGKKPKSRIPLISPERIEFGKKHKTTRLNFG